MLIGLSLLYLVGKYRAPAACRGRRDSGAIVIDGPVLGDPRAFVPPFTDKFKRQVAGLLTQKPVPAVIVKLIHGMLKFKGRF
jgi:hypothetical protein